MRRPNHKPAPLIAIAGGSGSGKSWLAQRLARTLNVTLICIDSFYRDRSHLSATRRAAINYDHPRAIDWGLLCEVLIRAKAGKSIELPRYSFEEHRRTGIHRVAPEELVVFEGLWALRSRLVRPLIDLGVFVDADVDLRRQRRLQRDVKERGRSRASVLRQFQEQVEPMHARFVEPQRRRADLILRSPISAADFKLLLHQIEVLWTTSPGNP